MVTLLAHSMMMFYLIGKGKAVKDAMAEHSVTATTTAASPPRASPSSRSARWRWPSR